MQLTLYTDYTLRVLAYLSLKAADERATITEIAEYYNISRNHLVKVVHHLAQKGFIKTSRGKSGGIRLARPAEEINIGTVVRETEPHFDIVECFDSNKPQCVVEPACMLKPVLGEATRRFLEVLDKYTVADIIRDGDLTTIEFQQREK